MDLCVWAQISAYFPGMSALPCIHSISTSCIQNQQIFSHYKNVHIGGSSYALHLRTSGPLFLHLPGHRRIAFPWRITFPWHIGGSPFSWHLHLRAPFFACRAVRNGCLQCCEFPLRIACIGMTSLGSPDLCLDLRMYN